MNRDELCSIGVIFAEDDKYLLSRYDTTEQDLFLKNSMFVTKLKKVMKILK